MIYHYDSMFNSYLNEKMDEIFLPVYEWYQNQDEEYIHKHIDYKGREGDRAWAKQEYERRIMDSKWDFPQKLLEFSRENFVNLKTDYENKLIKKFATSKYDFLNVIKMTNSWYQNNNEMKRILVEESRLGSFLKKEYNYSNGDILKHFTQCYPIRNDSISRSLSIMDKSNFNYQSYLLDDMNETGLFYFKGEEDNQSYVCEHKIPFKFKITECNSLW